MDECLGTPDKDYVSGNAQDWRINIRGPSEDLISLWLPQVSTSLLKAAFRVWKKAGARQKNEVRYPGRYL